jgi:hypothetical protein
MNRALGVAETTTLGLLALITGTSPPQASRQLALPPPLDLDMPEPLQVAQTHSEPSTMRSPTLRDAPKTPPSAGPGAVDHTVIPPSHRARTLVICFDGTGDQFDSDVRRHFFIPPRVTGSPHRAASSLHRTRTSSSCSRCSRRTTRVSRWFTIRCAATQFIIM